MSVVTTAAPSAAADGAEVGAVVHTTVAPKKKSSYSRDSCAWYAGQRCSTLRNCYDCLNIVLEREQVCTSVPWCIVRFGAASLSDVLRCCCSARSI